MINLDDMVIFTRVVEAGSFTGAAGALGLPKSTVSRRISQLEESLGVRLLERTTRVIRLTEIGRAYFERCSRIVSEVDEANQAVTRMQATPSGRLRITAPTEFGSIYLGGTVAAYLEKYPKVEIEVELTNRVVDLIEEGFDLGIRGGVLADSSLVAHKLAGGRTYLCASPEYLQRCGEPQTPEELSGHTMVFSPAAPGHHIKLVSSGGDEASVAVQGKLRVNSLAMARDAAAAGLGVAALPEMICWEALGQGRLKVVLAGWSLPGTGLYAVYPTRRYLSAKVRSFIDFLKADLTPPPWKSDLP